MYKNVYIILDAQNSRLLNLSKLYENIGFIKREIEPFRKFASGLGPDRNYSAKLL